MTEQFDLLGALPSGTTVIEASAGTGKTYALAGLVTRFVAEGEATLDQMLLITFGRAASQELRDRVRAQLVLAEAALADPGGVPDDADDLLRHLVATDVPTRHRRVRDALAGFDAATIATTHQFCQIVLRSLGVAGDTDSGVTLVEDLDDLVAEVVDDLYLQRFAHPEEVPRLTHAEALRLVREAVAQPHTRLVPTDPPPDSDAALRVDFTRAAITEVERRKRRLGILGYDDLLTRLADALEDEDAAARTRMRQRWSVVMVDEFQDTDPVQWKVLSRAFVGHARLVLIGDPKQAIYGFRGGDIVTYLDAARTAERKVTLGTNWRSDGPLVDRLGAVLQGAALGHPEIVVHPVTAHHTEHRLAGAPRNDPFRLRVVDRRDFGVRQDRTIGIDRLRDHIARDLAADIAGLLSSPATFGGEPVAAGDVAVIVDSHKDARAVKAALEEARIPAVYTGDTDVFGSPAADDWLRLLEAFEQPQRSGLVRAAAAGVFFGHDAAALAAGGDRLTEEVADTLRDWADHLRRRGIAAVFEAAKAAGTAERVLARVGGERLLTDLAHLAQLMHQAAHRDRLALPGLLEWLREERSGAGRSGERARRLDSDAAAVQVMTVWVSKGLQYPIVYLPFSFDRYFADEGVTPLFHDEHGQRCLDIGGERGPDHARHLDAYLAEQRADDLRLAYVALTRAQSQVVAWWAPSWNEVNSGLSRLLRGRGPGEALVAEQVPRAPSDLESVTRMRAWEAVGGPAVERSEIAEAPPPPAITALGALAARRFDRGVDVDWRRTSYSAIVRAAEEQQGLAEVTSEPEVGELDDETPVVGTTAVSDPTCEAAAAVPSPMADLPGGAAFGSLVHGVLEHADPEAPDPREELRARIEEQAGQWPVADLDRDALADALAAVAATPLGPLADGRSLAEIPLTDRLAELDFEIPLAGGDLGPAAEVRVAMVAPLLREHLAEDDPLRGYADRLEAPGLGDQLLRGYLSGSIDAVLRIPDGEVGHRFLIVDYKTNRLGSAEIPLTAADYTPPRLAEAMLGSDYPLQALLYVVVTHRYLRWRLGGSTGGANAGESPPRATSFRPAPEHLLLGHRDSVPPPSSAALMHAPERRPARQPLPAEPPAGYDPERHLGGVLYLYLRGMCGERTPIIDGHPTGVFAWRPPAGLVVALSELLDAASDAAADEGARR